MKKTSDDLENLKTLIRKLAMEVIQFFQPEIISDEDINRMILQEERRRKIKISNSSSQKQREMFFEEITSRRGLEKSQQKRGGNNVFLGDLKGCFGKCRHHSTLFKLVCDSVGILCKLECIYGFHAWNLVQLKSKFYYIDTSNQGDKLLEIRDYPLLLQQLLASSIYIDRNEQEDSDAKKSLKKLIADNQLEEEKIWRLQQYVNDDEKLREEYRVRPTKKGGGGDVSLYTITKNIPSRTKNFTQNNTHFLFKQGEVIAIKKLSVVEEGNKSGGLPRRFALREASYMKILDHPCIIEVLGFWESEEKEEVFIAMNSMDMDGEDFLRKMVRKDCGMKKLEKQIESVYFLLETARGMRYLSTLSIVHLDLNPKNIMISMNENNEITDVRIIDFGGAKNNDVKTSSFFGKSEYDSPEIRDQKIKKELSIMFASVKDELTNNVRFDERKIHNQLNTIIQKLFSLNNLGGMEDIFRYSQLKSQELNLEVSNIENWGEKLEKRFQGNIFGSSMLDFDCRADIFSFGVMMNAFLKTDVLPQELEGLKDRCINHDRRDRPSIDEIIHILKKHLSFFNEKVKEEEEFFAM